MINLKTVTKKKSTIKKQSQKELIQQLEKKNCHF